MTTIINIPFDGFYNSRYSGDIDNTQEQDAEHYVEQQEGEGIPAHLRLDAAEVSDLLLRHTDYRAAEASICDRYVAAFDALVSEAIAIDLGLKFEKMTSPREYNFETDRLFCFIDEAVVTQLFQASVADDHKALAGALKARFTSYDGFIPFYPNRLEDWLLKPVTDWDHNELGTLLLAVMAAKGVDKDWDWSVYYDVSEQIYEDVSAAVDWTAFEADVADLRAEKQLTWAEDNPDQPEPPYRCPETLDLFAPKP